MSDTHDMSEHKATGKTRAAKHARISPIEVANAEETANAPKAKDGDKPTVIRILDPKVEHTRDAWHDLKASANNLFLTARYHTIRALPAAVVNNSTNILGATHVMTEMMMLKASGDQTPLIKNYKNPLRWVWDPLETVFTGTMKQAGIQKTNPALMPSTGNWFKDKYLFITDTKKATHREIDRQETKQCEGFENKNLHKFQKTDACKNLVAPHVDPAITARIDQKKHLLNAQEVRHVKDAIISHAAPEWQAHETQRSADADLVRHEQKNALGLTAVNGHGEIPFKKDAYKADLTRKLDGMSKNARAAEVKKMEGELAQISGGPVYSSMRLANPWQMRSTFAGLVVWALSAVIPDKKESDADVEKMAVLRSTNLPSYVAERFKEAVWVPGWFNGHKRQMIGLGIMASGVCSLLGSWRNRKTLLTDAEGIVEFAALLGEKKLLKEGATGTIDSLTKTAGNEISKDIVKTTRYTYEFNPSYFATSTLTFLSSLPLLFASDNERGYSGFGALMTGRLAFLPSSIGKKVRDKEPGVGFYTAGMASFQAENWAQALAGGAEKRKNPKTGAVTVVDHDAERKAAHEKAKAIKEHKGEEREPTRIVTYVSSREMAMPDRAQVNEQQKISAAV